jgi:uncharacterized protein YaeQ
MASGIPYNFSITLSHIGRDHYESFSIQPALHPSETPQYLVARVLALAIEHTEGIAFSRGLQVAEEPAVWIHDLTGTLQAWIEVGTPDARRLHKASKASPRVAVYYHKDPAAWLRSLAAAGPVHASEQIALYQIAPDLIAALTARLERRNTLVLTVSEDHLYVELGGEALEGELRTLPWPTRD